MKYLKQLVMWLVSPMSLFMSSGVFACTALNCLVKGDPWGLLFIATGVFAYWLGMLSLADTIRINTLFQVDLWVRQYQLHLKSQQPKEQTDI